MPEIIGVYGLKYCFITALGALIFVPFVLAADVESVRLDRESMRVEVSGYCSADVAQVRFYSFIDKETPIYAAGVMCKDGRYDYKDNLRQWNMAAGDYLVGVAENGILKVEAEDILTVGEPIVIESVTSSLSLDTEVMNSSVAAQSQIMFEDEAEESGEKIMSSSVPDIWKKMFDIVDGLQAVTERASFFFSKIVKVTAAVFVDIFTQSLTLSPNGRIVLPEGDGQITGQGIISSGAIEVFIANSQVESGSKILLTPLSAATEISPLAVTSKNPGLGFIVSVAIPAVRDVRFDWLLINTYQTKENTSADIIRTADDIILAEEPVLPAIIVDTASVSDAVIVTTTSAADSGDITFTEDQHREITQ